MTMNPKKKTSAALSCAVTAAATVLLAVCAAGCGKDSANSGAPQSGAGGGDAAKTVAPAEQRYPDGRVVPYNAAPAGSTPGNPASIKR
jgi:hypothetical protein